MTDVAAHQVANATDAGQHVVEHVYRPRGRHRELFRCRAPEVVSSGPAGTGKSRAILEYLFWIASTFAGSKILIARKTRESITNSIQLIWEEEVLPPGCGIRLHQRNQRYTFPNGSIVALGGLDKDTRLFSSQWDVIYVNEATELTEGNWESLNRALRSGKLAWKQLIGDCNPDAPTHWIMRRIEAGKITWIQTRHEDNPRADEAYLNRLRSLTGIRKERLYHGRWVAAEGQVYDQWEVPPDTHLFTFYPNGRETPPPDWDVLWSVDFGFTNPFVWQDWRLDGDKRLWLHREIYMTLQTVDQHAARILEVTADDPPPRAVVCDHDAENRAQLEKHLRHRTTSAFKEIDPGLEAVMVRIRRAGDGMPRLFVRRDALVDRDPELWDRKQPVSTAQEFPVYTWAKRPDGAVPTSRTRRRGQDTPIDQWNHGMDAARYAVAWADGLRHGWRPEAIPVGLTQTSRWLSGQGDPSRADASVQPAASVALPILATGARVQRLGFGNWRPRFGR